MTPFRPWHNNQLAPDAEWQRIAECTGVVDVECDLWGEDDRPLRNKLFDFIDRSPAHWLLTTRFPGRVKENWRLTYKGPDGKPIWTRPNVTLLIHAQTQAELDALAPELLKLSHLAKLGLDLRRPKEKIDIHKYIERFNWRGYEQGICISLIRLAPGEWLDNLD